MTDIVLQGKNEYLYFFITRDLECIGTGNGTDKTFTTKKSPLADKNLSGTVTVDDVEVYTGDALRTNMVAATVSSVTEATGSITLSAAPTAGKKIYCTYAWVYGFATYVQDYSVTSDLDTKEIQALSSASEESIETVWKYEGTFKFWNANDLAEDLLAGIDQTTDTVGGDYSASLKIPTLQHQFVIKRVRGTTTTYQALGTVKINSLDESGKGGDLSERSLKFKALTYKRKYTPTVGSGL